MFFTVAAAMVSLLCVVGAARRAWLLGRHSEQAQELARALRRAHAPTLPAANRNAELAVAMREVLAAPTPAQALARLDEHLADVERELDVGADVPRAAARIALASGTALAVAALARNLATGSMASVVSGPLLPFALGVAGATGAALAGQLAQARADRLRVAYDDLARALERKISGGGRPNMQVDSPR